MDPEGVVIGAEPGWARRPLLVALGFAIVASALFLVLDHPDVPDLVQAAVAVVSALCGAAAVSATYRTLEWRVGLASTRLLLGPDVLEVRRGHKVLHVVPWDDICFATVRTPAPLAELMVEPAVATVEVKGWDGGTLVRQQLLRLSLDQTPLVDALRSHTTPRGIPVSST